jgi:hypothetical protein
MRVRRTYVTRMLVCEGDADEHFARHIGRVYLERDCGTVLQRRNAHGFGGARALEIALQLKGQTAHDGYGILIDADRHWGIKERDSARAAGIVVIASSPCLEATLLAIDGQRVYRLSSENKAAFEARYHAPANRDGVIRRNFPRAKLDAARGRVAVIDQFLRFIEAS